MGSYSVITPEDVMESLMNDGTIDALRLKIINQLKANEELKKTTIKMAEQSKVLNTPGAEKQTKRELFDALRQELETQVLEMASKSVWELILDNNGLGKEISQTLERAFCRLSGREPPLFPLDAKENANPSPNANVKESVIANPNSNANANDKRKGKGKGKGKAKETAASDSHEKEESNSSSSKKRSFTEMNNARGGGQGEERQVVVAKSSDEPPPAAVPAENSQGLKT